MGMPPSSSSVSLQHVMQPYRICIFREICSLLWLSLPTTALRSPPPCSVACVSAFHQEPQHSVPIQSCRLVGKERCHALVLHLPHPGTFLPGTLACLRRSSSEPLNTYRILGHLELAHKSSSIGPVPWVDPFHRTLTRPPSSQEQPPRWAGRTTPRIPMPPPSGP